MRKKCLLFIIMLFGIQISSNTGKAISVFASIAMFDRDEGVVTVDFPENIKKQIDDYFFYRNKIGKFNGVVLFADGNKVFKKAYGVSNFSSKVPLTVNTSFQLASVSKPITAIAILMLEQEGKLNLEDYVQKFIPDFPYKGITVEQLLAHRSGLGNYIYWSGKYWPDKNILMTNDDVVDLMVKYRPGIYYRPNRRFFYTNTNYELLASIVEAVTKKSFGSFLEENIFEPLQMKNTFLYSPSAVKEHDVATGYKNRKRPYNPFFLDGVYGDKGVYSTVIDLLKLNNALRDGVLLSESTKKNAYTNRTKKYNRSKYGLGWRLKEISGKKIVYHHGWWRGFRSYYIRSIEDDKTIIVLTNIINGSKLRNNTMLELLEPPYMNTDFYLANNRN